MPHDSLDSLLPQLEVPAHLDDASAPPATGEERPVQRSFVGGLIVSYIVDEGDTVRTLRHCDLRKRQMDEPRVHERALENLARHVEAVGIRLRPYGSMMAVLFDGDLEATLMLHPALWIYLHDQMGDELVVAAPARDVLAVSRRDSPDGIAELHAVVEKVWPREDHRLTAELFELRGGEWRIFSIPSE